MVSVFSSMLTNAFFAPQIAVPVTVQPKSALLESIDPKEFAKELLTKKQFSCFTKLMGKESAWKPHADNPTSSAKGIGQLLDSTYKNLGMKHSNIGTAQVVGALAYIGRKYGSGGPCAAWKFWQTQKAKTGTGWY